MKSLLAEVGAEQVEVVILSREEFEALPALPVGFYWPYLSPCGAMVMPPARKASAGELKARAEGALRWVHDHMGIGSYSFQVGEGPGLYLLSSCPFERGAL